MSRKRSKIDDITQSLALGDRLGVAGLAAWVALSFLLAIALGAAIQIDRTERSMERQAREARNLGVARLNEIDATFDLLDRITAPPCSDAQTTDMRSLLLNADIIQDIVFLRDDNTVCATVNARKDLTLPIDLNAGFLLDNGVRVWRDVTLPYAPKRLFSIILRNHYIIIAHTLKLPDHLGDGSFAVSRMYINHRAGKVWTLQGDPLAISIPEFRDAISFWRSGRFVSLGCAPDTRACLEISAPWSAMIRSDAAGSWAWVAIGVLPGGAAAALFARQRLRHRRSLATRLRKALKAGALSLEYQPIVDTATGAIVSAEALLRWPLRGGASVSPALFIPEAEKAGFIGDVTRFVIAAVGRELGDVLRRDAGFQVSLNITADDLTDPRLYAALARHFESRQIAPRQIALELTERRAAQAEAATPAINRLRRAGYSLYIDDFGTGYSSLSYLSDLTVDAIKLDKSFTDTIGTASLRARLVPSILGMARDVGIPVIVEGVESEAQAAFFRRHEVTLMQGWLFSPAIAAADLIAMVGRERGASAAEIGRPDG